MQPTDLTKAKLKALASDLSALVGHTVNPDGASVVVALGKIPAHERAQVMSDHGLTAEAPNSPAEAIGGAGKGDEPRGPAQRVLTQAEAVKVAEAITQAEEAKAAKRAAPADPFEGLADDVPVWQLLSGPGRALLAAGASDGDMVIDPTDEVKGWFAGCQRARMTVKEARAVVARGRGRIGKSLAAANEASRARAEGVR